MSDSQHLDIKSETLLTKREKFGLCVVASVKCSLVPQAAGGSGASTAVDHCQREEGGRGRGRLGSQKIASFMLI